MHKRFHSFKESVRAGATKLQKELPDILKKYGLDAPDVSSGDTDGVDDFFKWLRACLAMLDTVLISTRILALLSPFAC